MDLRRPYRPCQSLPRPLGRLMLAAGLVSLVVEIWVGGSLVLAWCAP